MDQKLVYDVTITWFPMYIVSFPRTLVIEQKIQPILILPKLKQLSFVVGQS